MAGLTGPNPAPSPAPPACVRGRARPALGTGPAAAAGPLSTSPAAPKITPNITPNITLPFTIVILRPFMRAIPGELQDAAMVDGATRLRFFVRILLPLSRPALMTVSVLAFVTSWNNYLLPFLVFTSQEKFTLPLGVATFQSTYSQDTAAIFAFTALSMLPALGFFLLAQRRIVGGLSGLAGSIKG
ncbi:MAG TPA: carbohydrate ABC transporter permease [Streptosporangiaceae bacterium]|nr:carbohydrate ABC transporter permease [Streptosporangiaceae bacterium]